MTTKIKPSRFGASVGLSPKASPVKTSKPKAVPQPDTSDKDYHGLLRTVRHKLATHTGPLFTTSASNLFDIYLVGLPISERPVSNCNTCRQFIERFGDLVYIEETSGRTRSLFWDENSAPAFYEESVQALRREVEAADVTGIFVSGLKEWGTAVTGPWNHIAATPPASMVWKHALKSADQQMAEKLEDRKNVLRALGEFKLEDLKKAVTFLESDAMYRAEAVLGQAVWLRDLKSELISTKTAIARHNIIWKAVAEAPAGFCHPRSSMIGTLLEDLANGLDFDDASRKFAAKMHPLQYQRPQAAPTAGNIAAAEKIFEKMDLSRSLERRYAKVEELTTLWRQPSAKNEASAASGKLFGHLTPKSTAPATRDAGTPPQTLTWEKFQRTILLPGTRQVELFTPTSGPYAGILTAVHADAPPVLQWDLPDNRNPVSWYVYSRGSSASNWGLVGNSWVNVPAVTFKPNMWNGGFEHQGGGVLFVLEGARDSTKPSAGLFPEILRSELREVRSVIEAYSKAAHPSGAEEGTANGLMLSTDWNVRLRVTNAEGVRSEYKLDRWD